MFKNLVSDISPAYSILCLLFALLVSVLLYYRQTENSELTAIKVWILGVLRFISVFVISLLLLNFVLKWTNKTVSKPMVVLGVDNSLSMQNSGNTELNRLANEISNSLERDYNVLKYSFSNKPELCEAINISGEVTNISEFLKLPQTTLLHEKPAVMIMVTDGINNSGDDPAWYSETMTVPVYSIATGDTVQHSDILIDNVIYNNEVYEGNSFPLFINIKAYNLINDTAVISVFKNDKLLKTESVVINSNDFFTKVYFNIDSEGKGSTVYRIMVQALEREQNTGNNEKYITVTVRTDKKKILFLYNAPTPDAALFKQAVSNKQAYEWEYTNIKDFNSKPADYALIILNQIPSKTTNGGAVLKSIIESKVPLLFIAGQMSDISVLNSYFPGNIIEHKKNLFDDSRAAINNAFSLFTLDMTGVDLNKMPPLNVPFGEYGKFPSSNVLFYQKAGVVETNRPLISFMDNGDRKIGFVFGEGLWRWKLYEYKSNLQHTFTNELVTKTVQYLITNEKKDRLVIDYKHEYYTHQNINISAKLYNASYELITEPELHFELIDSEKNIYKYNFNKNNSYYTLNCGSLSRGQYSFVAKATLGDETIVKNGSFVVIKSNTEQMTTLANHNLLFSIAKKTGGKVFLSHEVNKLIEQIYKVHKPEKVINKNTRYNELLNYKWLFVLVFLVIATEWFLRKFWGGI